MIDASTADALSRVAARAHDVLQAYRGGFEPLAGDVTARAARFERSLDPLSVVAPEGTFFVVRDRAGAPLLSRDGSFAFVEGELRAADGTVALGSVAGSTTLHALRVERVDAALGRAGDARIEPDGSVVYPRATLDPRTSERRSERVVLGRLALARLPAGTLPERVDATHVRAPKGVIPLIGLPGEATFAPLTVSARDLGRLNLIAGLRRLQEAYLSLEALLAANRSRGELERTTLDLVK